MAESLTEGNVENSGLENQPTAENSAVQNSAESQNQETISGEQNESQEAVSGNDTADEQKQTEENGGASTETDDGLAKFAKSQGIDNLEELTDREKKLLKIASDNQKAYRSSKNNNSSKEMSQLTDELSTLPDDATDIQKLHRKVQTMENDRKVEQFWNQEGRDRSLETEMISILKEKSEQLGKGYAYTLSQDLDTLYGLAQLRAGGSSDEQSRRERESIRKQQMAGAPQAHAVHQNASGPKVTAQWIENEYNPSNPEHRQMLADYYAGK